jgi:thiol-disulfide isomerase/thioredoxin
MALQARRGIILWSLAFAAVVGWIVYLIVVLPAQVPTEYNLVPPELRGVDDTPFDLNWKLLDLDGKEFNLKQLEGSPILVNLWAIWCGPCIAEMPSLSNLADNSKLSEYRVACIAMGERETLEEVRAFVKKHNLKVPVYYSEIADVPPLFRVPGLPTTFVINSKGMIVSVVPQAAQWDAPDVADRLLNLAHPKSQSTSDGEAPSGN